MKIKMLNSTPFIDEGQRVDAKRGETVTVSDSVGTCLVACGLAVKPEGYVEPETQPEPEIVEDSEE